MADVALVTATGTAATTADTLWRTLLEGLGHNVALVADEAAVAAGKALHVIGDSCAAAQIGTKYEDVDAGVVCCDVDSPDQLNMFTGSNNNSSGTTWTIIGHDITAGLTPGTVTMKSAGNSGRWGWDAATVGAGAEIFATRPGAADRVLGCGYDTGSLDVDGNPMPGRRVFLAYLDTFAAGLNTNGQLVFTQAVTWALHTPGPAVTVWDGTTEQPAAAAVWDGAAEQPLAGLEVEA
jgi:hypothetical protein